MSSECERDVRGTDIQRTYSLIVRVEIAFESRNNGKRKKREPILVKNNSGNSPE